MAGSRITRFQNQNVVMIKRWTINISKDFWTLQFLSFNLYRLKLVKCLARPLQICEDVGRFLECAPVLMSIPILVVGKDV